MSTVTRRVLPFAITALLIGWLPIVTHAQSANSSSTQELNKKTQDGVIRAPELGIKIPELNLVDIPIKDGQVSIPWLAQYISAVYRYLMGASVIVAIIMVMYGGFRYTMGAAMGDAKAGKKIITDAIMGLIVLMAGYVILETINPRLVKLSALSPTGPVEDENAVYADRDTDDRDGGGGAGGGGGSPQKVSQNLEGLFRAYASCYGYDWRILKAVAMIESSLNPNSQVKSGKYQGLFQFNGEACTSLTKKYPSSLNLDCGNLKDPETNTAAAAVRFNWSLGVIQTRCASQNITPEEIIHLMYVGHNNGPGVMLYALDHGGCKLSEQPAAVAAYSTDFKAGDKQREDYAKDVPPEYAIQKWRKGDEVVAELKKDGVTDLYPPDGMNDDTCPRLTGIRALAP